MTGKHTFTDKKEYKNDPVKGETRWPGSEAWLAETVQRKSREKFPVPGWNGQAGPRTCFKDINSEMFLQLYFRLCKLIWFIMERNIKKIRLKSSKNNIFSLFLFLLCQSNQGPGISFCSLIRLSLPDRGVFLFRNYADTGPCYTLVQSS